MWRPAAAWLKDSQESGCQHEQNAFRKENYVGQGFELPSLWVSPSANNAGPGECFVNEGQDFVNDGQDIGDSNKIDL